MSDDFQSLASQQGKHYEAFVAAFLVFRGWKVLSEKPVTMEGGEVDLVAEDPNGTLWWIECKGSYRDQPGLERTDTVKKAIAVAWFLKRQHADRPAYAIYTTNKPRAGSIGARMLSAAIEDGLIDAVVEVGGMTR